MHEILHILGHAFFDTLKVLPSLFLIYFLIEYLEHKNNNKAHHLFMKSEKAGPLFGSLFGCIPQCGFSVIASELYSKRFITLGTIIAVFVATSDEAIPMLLSEPSLWTKMLLLIGIKLVVAIIAGFSIDALTKKKHHVHHHHCEEEHHEHHHYHGNCESCHDGVLKSTLIHVVKIFIFIFAISVVLGFLMKYIPKDMLLVNKWLQPFITPIIGLIPNCAASVLLTELYIEGIITLSSLTGGLCAGAGVGLIVLFKLNKNVKENFSVVFLLYAIGVATSFLLTLMNI